MRKHIDLTGQLFPLLRSGEIAFGGHAKLRIYGRLDCRSGKRMRMEHRVFFASEREARQLGFRPCGHCMPDAYREWINGKNRVEARYTTNDLRLIKK